MNPQAERLIRELHLQPHPEGGFFGETYRSAMQVTRPDGAGRKALTSIHFLLTSESFSAFHRLAADESWHFYEGDPVTVEVIDASGRHEQRVLGAGNARQTFFVAGVWFAAHIERHDGYALVGCDVAPGFEFEDFELAKRDDLMALFPQHAPLIGRLTR